jgi:hypothetical protein
LQKKSNIITQFLALLKVNTGYERDGMTRVNKGFKKLGPKFGQGDIVGVGLDTTSGELFFTRNGEVVGKRNEEEKKKKKKNKKQKTKNKC